MHFFLIVNFSLYLLDHLLYFAVIQLIILKYYKHFHIITFILPNYLPFLEFHIHFFITQYKILINFKLCKFILLLIN